MPMRFFFSSRRRHTRWTGDWSSDVCSSDLSPPTNSWGPWTRNSDGACTDRARGRTSRIGLHAEAFTADGKKDDLAPGSSRGRKPRGTCDRGRLRRPREPLACGLDVRSLLALRALRDFELDFLSFLERFESAHLNRGEVRKQILAAVIRGYEPITLGIIEPLHRTCWHRAFLNFRTGEPSTMPVLQRSRGI